MWLWLISSCLDVCLPASQGHLKTGVGPELFARLLQQEKKEKVDVLFESMSQ